MLQPSTLWPSSGVPRLADIGSLVYGVCSCETSYCSFLLIQELNSQTLDNSNICQTDFYIHYTTFLKNISGVYFWNLLCKYLNDVME